MPPVSNSFYTMSTKPQSSELHPGPGFRIKSHITRPDKELIEKFREYATPDISDLMNRFYTMHPALRNLVNDAKILGPVCTVKVFPGDNLMVHKALDIALPGDIIVVDAGGATTNGIIGDLIVTKAQHRGIAGFVIDGFIRDLPGIQSIGMPVYTLGITPVGPLHRGPGEINFPISCGGIVVNPGDIVYGDENGLVVIGQDFAEDLLDKLIHKREALETYIRDVRKGDFSNEWVDRILNDSNCLLLD